jgi:acyl-CoA reductase-like NAD-dependent aldehyde dehydrogenase
MLDMALGLLARSAQFVKCASGQAFIPRLFAHSLYEAEAKLGACLEVAEWPGGTESLEAALFAEADCVAATGSDETLAAIRKDAARHTRALSVTGRG